MAKSPQWTSSQKTQSIQNPRGSVWHRWDPHIHCPGTVLNDQFSGANAWEDFLKRVENSDPIIEAIGITDYYLLDLYEKFLAEKSKGRLPKIGLVFPNVELRFSIETAKGSPINAHLLISPEEEDHIEAAKRFINGLTYRIGDDTYCCNSADLTRLGKKHDKSVMNDRKALEIGANQFKVNYEQLFEAYNNSAWAKKNILIAISGSNGDGTPGLKEDSSFASLRTV